MITMDKKKTFSGLNCRRGNDFLAGEQRLVKNNQDNQVQNITLCNMYFSKRYTWCTMGSGAK